MTKHPEHPDGGPCPRYLLDGPYGLGSWSAGYIAADTIDQAETIARGEVERIARIDDPNGRVVYNLRAGSDLLADTFTLTDGEWNLSEALADGYPLERWTIGPRGGLRREGC